jgi:hypothetical protein
LETGNQAASHRLTGLAIVRIDLDRKACYGAEWRTVTLFYDIYVKSFCVLGPLADSIVGSSFMPNAITWFLWTLGEIKIWD